MAEMSHVQIPDHPSAIMPAQSSWFTCDKVLWILRAPSQVCDDRRIGCNVKKWSKTCEEWHEKHTIKTCSKKNDSDYTGTIQDVHWEVFLENASVSHRMQMYPTASSRITAIDSNN